MNDYKDAIKDLLERSIDVTKFIDIWVRINNFCENKKADVEFTDFLPDSDYKMQRLFKEFENRKNDCFEIIRWIDCMIKILKENSHDKNDHKDTIEKLMEEHYKLYGDEYGQSN